MTDGEQSTLRDRVAGVMIGTAVGDALGAGYEFGSAPLGPAGPDMIGGGLGRFAPGEWTDDTTMAWCILDVTARGLRLLSDDSLSAVARNFRSWYDSRPPDIGIQTSAVLRAAGPDPTAAALHRAAADYTSRNPRSAGNGSLMRTAPIALAHLGDRPAIARAAAQVSALTHADPRAGQACVLWSLAIDRAAREGVLDVRSGLEFVDDDEARTFWASRIEEAEQGPPSGFNPNGWVVSAFQAAWSAVLHTPVPSDEPARHACDSLAAAIAIGDDTDTVAAIAGGLLGARWGASAFPARWREMLHGYPGITGDDLATLALANAGLGDGAGDGAGDTD